MGIAETVRRAERRFEEFELLRDIAVAERQLVQGQGIPHEEAKTRVLSSSDQAR